MKSIRAFSCLLLFSGITGIMSLSCNTQADQTENERTVADTIRVAPPDGINDRDLILKAFEQAKSGSVVQFAQGTYVLGGTIRVEESNLILLGHPDGTILRGCDPAEFTDPVQAILNCGSFELAGPGQQMRGFTIEYAWHGLLVGCCFPENMEELEAGNTFLADQPGGQLIENNTFRFCSTGIRVFGRPADSVSIRNNTFSSNYHGVTVNGSGVKIRRNLFEAPDPGMVPLVGYPDNAVGILPFSSLKPGEEHATICRENVVEGNTIRDLPVGIYIAVYEPGETCENNLIRDNDILMNPVRHGVTEANADPVIVDVTDPYLVGIPIALDNQEGGLADSVRSSIIGTVITGNRIRNANGLAIELLNATGSVVRENEILGVIRRDPFPGNTLRAAPWEEANGSGIWVSPGSTENDIEKNIIIAHIP